MRARATGPTPDLATRVGSLELPNPVMTASGTAGHSDELAAYLDLGSLGAHVVKSLAAFEWAGNPPPRLHPVKGAMLNSIGLQGPGLEAWLGDELPQLERRGVGRVVVSIWGRTIEDYAHAAALLRDAPSSVIAVEVNLSCPNLEDRRHMFAHSASIAEAAMAATAAANRPRWAKLSPNVADLAEIVAAVRRGGADAVTLVNTLLGMAIDTETARPVLGGIGGGLSGPAVHPVAVRAVHDIRAGDPDVAIIGVGGVTNAVEAVELLMAGANAVQVGTATFADPRAPAKVLAGLVDWCARHGVQTVGELVGAVHRRTPEPPPTPTSHPFLRRTR
ncbi:MAG: dihydroorotate dehydrogenase [Acidimicrobiia bacterium]